MVDFGAVDNQESVVAFLVDMHFYWRVLAVVALQVQAELPAYPLRVDAGPLSISRMEVLAERIKSVANLYASKI